MFLLAFLLVQPIMGVQGETCEAMCSGEMNSKCPVQEDDAPEKNGCATNQCNPFMSCSSGNFYIVEGFFIDNAPLIGKAAKLVSINDNRILSSVSECWHPPELN